MSKKQSIWSKNFILICLAALATNVTMRMLDSNLASYAAVAWDSKSLGGQLTSFFNIGSIAMAFISGSIVDKHGRRNCVVIGCLLFAIPTVAMALIPLPGVALGVRFIQGIAKGIVTVGMASVVSDITPRERMNEGMGMFNLGNTISFAFGPMLGLALVDIGGYKMMFLACAAVYALGSLFTAPIDYEKKMRESQNTTSVEEAIETDAGVEYKGIWKLIEKRAIMPAFIHTVFFGGYACILVFVTVYAQEILKLSSTQISLFYTVAAVAMMAVRLSTAKVADKYGSLAMLIPGHLVMAGSLLLLAIPAKVSYVAFLAAGACYGIGMAVVTPTLNAEAVIRSPANRTSTANATFYFMADFGILIASTVFGKLIDAAASPAVGYLQTFLISIGIIAFSLIMCILTMRKKG